MRSHAKASTAAPTRRRATGLGLIALAIAAFLALAAAPAQAAAPAHPALPALDQSGFVVPCGAAVDSNGDLYVASYETKKVQIFDPSGAAIAEFSTSGIGGEGPCGIAVDSSGDVYVTRWGTDVYKYKPEGAGYPPTSGTTYAPDTSVKSGTGRIASGTAPAVDPATDNVYVAQGSHISEYEPDGETVSTTIGSGVSGASYYGVNVLGSNGDVYATDEAHNKVYVFNAAGSQVLAEFNGADSEAGAFNFAYPYLAVDQSNGHVYVSDIEAHHVVDEFDAAGHFVSEISHTSPSFSNSEPSDIAVDNSGGEGGAGEGEQGRVYVTSGVGSGRSFAYGPLAYAIFYKLTAAKAGSGGGTVSGPGGIDCGSTCSAEFASGEEVTLTATPDSHSSLSGWSGCDSEPGPGECTVTLESDTEVTATFVSRPLTVVKSGLGSGRVTSSPAGIDCGPTCEAHYPDATVVTLSVAANPGSRLNHWSGCDSLSGEQCTVTLEEARSVTANFTAKPALSGLTADPVADTSATLSAQVNPSGEVTSYRFEYVDATTYAADVAAAEAEGESTEEAEAEGRGFEHAASTPTAFAGAGTTATAVSRSLSGLSQHTGYRFRIVASNLVGESASAATGFTTYSSPSTPEGGCPNEALRSGPSAKLPDCRAYEQATPPDKGGADVSGTLFSVRAALAGDAITSYTISGIPGASGFQDVGAAYVSHRAGGSWSTAGALPPASYGDYAKVRAWTPDLALSFSRAAISPNISEPALLARQTSDGSIATLSPYSTGAGEFVGASADDSRLFFESANALAPGGVAGKPEVYAYDRGSGAWSLVSALPASEGGGAPAEGAFAGPYNWFGDRSSLDEGGVTVNQNEYLVGEEHAVSSDGQKAYFTSAGNGALYLREGIGGSEKTVQVNAPQRTDCAEEHEPCSGEPEADPFGRRPAAFQMATPSGSMAFFTSPEELTDDANTGPPAPLPAIGRAEGDGTNPNPSLVSQVVSGKGYGNVAGDSEHVYWSDAQAGTIGRAELDGENPEPEFITGLENPQGVAVDGNHLFWTSADTAEEEEITRALPEGNKLFQYRILYKGKYAEADVPRTTCTDTSPYFSFTCEVSAERDGAPGVDEQQTLTLRGVYVNGFQLTLTCDGTTTRDIGGAGVGGSLDSLGADILQALEETCGAGNFAVIQGAGRSAIGRADLNGAGAATNLEPACITGASESRGIDVHAGRAYWVNNGSEEIGRADVSGSCASADSGAEQDFVAAPNGDERGDIAVDDESIYYSTHSENVNNGVHSASVVRLNADGSGRSNQVLGVPDSKHAPSLALDGAHLYWGDFSSGGRIGRRTLGGVEDAFSDATDSHGDVFVANHYGPISVYGPDGSLITKTFAPYGTASGQAFELAVDSQGYLYVNTVNTGDGEILKFKPSNPGSAPTPSTTYSLDSSLGESSPGAEDGDGVIDPGPTANAVSVNPSNDDVYTSHSGTSEVQELELSGFSEGETFKLTGLPAACSSSATGPIAYSAAYEARRQSVESALEAACSGGANDDFSVGFSPLRIAFRGRFADQVLGQLSCAAVSSASGSCSVSTRTPGVSSYISQYHSDGTQVTNTIGSGVPSANYLGVNVYGANHDVYAADENNKKAYVFSAGNLTGAPSAAIDGSGTPQGSFNFYTNISNSRGTHIAVDQSNGHLYLLDDEHKFLDQFDLSGAYLSQVATAGSNPAGVAIDRSGGAADGDIYVTNPSDIYVTNPSAGTLEAYDHSYTPIPALSHTGYDAEPDFITDAPAPAGLTLDAGHVYWVSGRRSRSTPATTSTPGTAPPASSPTSRPTPRRKTAPKPGRCSAPLKTAPTSTSSPTACSPRTQGPTGRPLAPVTALKAPSASATSTSPTTARRGSSPGSAPTRTKPTGGPTAASSPGRRSPASRPTDGCCCSSPPFRKPPTTAAATNRSTATTRPPATCCASAASRMARRAARRRSSRALRGTLELPKSPISQRPSSAATSPPTATGSSSRPPKSSSPPTSTATTAAPPISAAAPPPPAPTSMSGRPPARAAAPKPPTPTAPRTAAASTCSRPERAPTPPTSPTPR